MNINLNSLGKTFAAKTEKTSKPVSKGGTSKSTVTSANMDTVSISREGLEKSLTARLARSTANEIDNYATPEKLSALKQKIDSGEYNVSSSAVANAILGTDFTD